MNFFQQANAALRGPTGVQQTPADIIITLNDRLSPLARPADRRQAALSLKGLARPHKQLVGARALQRLLLVIQNDVDLDPVIGRAAIETVIILCDTVDVSHTQRDLPLEHTDKLLEDKKTAHKLFVLLGDQDHLLQYSACVLLTTILQNRRQRVQEYFMSARNGPSLVIALLESKKDIVNQCEHLLALCHFLPMPAVRPFVGPFVLLA
jgi:hypothetical protein